MPTVHILVKGKVQGVFFRASARDKAHELSLKGWVRNTDAGDVEIQASGSQELLDRFISWCHQGPSRAIVTRVEVNNLSEQDFVGYIIIR